MRGHRAEERFRQLHSEHFAALLAYAIRRVPSPDQAADVVADTLLVAWRRLDAVPEGPDARLWLFGVARMTLANSARSQVRQQRLALRLRQQLCVAVAGTEIEASDAAIDLRRVLGSLDPIDRELVQLTVWEGCTPSEAATVVGIRAETARTRLHRTRNMLRSALADGHATAPVAPTKGGWS